MGSQRAALIDNGVNLEAINKMVQSIQENRENGKCKFRAKNRWVGGWHNASTVDGFYMAGQEQNHEQPFRLHNDEPAVLGGTDMGANPVESLLNAVAACLTTSIVAHAAVGGIEIREVESELDGDIDLAGFFGLDEDVPKGFTNIRIKMSVDMDPENFEKLRSLVDFSPVYNTITKAVQVDIQIEQKQV